MITQLDTVKQSDMQKDRQKALLKANLYILTALRVDNNRNQKNLLHVLFLKKTEPHIKLSKF